MTFPAIAPTKIELELPEYRGSAQEFATSDLIVSPLQFIGMGTLLKLQWDPASRSQHSALKNYYTQQRRIARFTLPTAINDELPVGVKNALIQLKAEWWIISSPWSSSPLNFGDVDCELFAIALTLKSV